MTIQFTQNEKLNRLITYGLIWLALCGVGLYFRLYPLIYFVSDDSQEKATAIVVNQIRQKIIQNIARQSPMLTPAQKTQLVQVNLNKILAENKDNFHRTVYQAARKLDKNNPFASKEPYLLASDSYLYYDLTENILATGSISDTFKGSKYLNKRMLAPNGHWEPLNIHPYVGYYLYKIMFTFNPNISLMHAVSFTPFILLMLTLIPFLFICYLLRASYPAILTGGIYFVLSPIFVKRSSFGWYDNDPYNTLFPITISALLFWALTDPSNKRRLYSFSILTFLAISLYALFWQGWVFMAGIIALAGTALLIYNQFFLKQGLKTKPYLIGLALILLGTLLGITLLFGFKEFFTLFREGFKALKEFSSPSLSVWPDLYIGVGELHDVSLTEVADMLGGFIFMAIAFLGFCLCSVNIFRDKDYGSKSGAFVIILGVFFLFSFFAMLNAQRFALLCLVPMSFFFILGIDALLHFWRRAYDHYRAKKKNYPKVIYLGLSAALTAYLVIVPLVRIHHKIPTLLNKIFNDTWLRTLKEVKQKTPPESIINTWWSPGHFIKAIAKRRVTFDGATINFPQAYWLSRAYLSTTEREALGWLRMLNNSSNMAPEYLIKQGFALSEARDLLASITPLSKRAARDYLSDRLTSDQTEALLQYTHKSPPPTYLLLYNDFVKNNLQMVFVGRWDFKKIEEINNSPELQKNAPKTKSGRYIDFLWNIAGGRPADSGPLSPVLQTNDMLYFQEGIQIDLDQMRVLINSKKFSKGIPHSLIYLKNNHIFEKTFQDATLAYSVFLAQNEDETTCILAEEKLARSLLFKLYYFRSKGLKYFSPVIHQTDLTGRTDIYVYRVDWNKFLEDIKQDP